MDALWVGALESPKMSFGRGPVGTPVGVGLSTVGVFAGREGSVGKRHRESGGRTLRANRVALSMGETCDCAAEHLQVRVVESRPPRPRQRVPREIDAPVPVEASR